MRKVYLDSCIAIYLVEEHAAFSAPVERELERFDGIVCHSPLTELECLVQPLRLKRQDLIDKFTGFFAIGLKLDMPDTVYREAARLRAESGIRTPDALHLATARYHACTELWTNDDRLAEAAGGLAVNITARHT